ncbi:MAG: PorT family protein [Chitinophagaceae bacterium]|nr:PorT family protein [Chitinophagaceae bacterium]
MIKTGLFSFLFMWSVCCSAQKPLMGVFVGPQLTTAKFTNTGYKQDTKSKVGFQAGFGLKVPFENKLFFSPAAIYSLKGYKVTLNRPTFPPDPLATDNNTTIHTFELAALFQYDFSTQPSHMFVKFGPSLDFQIAGKEKFNRSTGGPVDRSMSFGFGDYGRYSGNFLFQLGYEMDNGLIVFGQYSYGLANLNNADGGPKVYHRVFGVSVGKYFNQKSVAVK